MWKRNLAGILDFILALIVFGALLSKVFGNEPYPLIPNPPGSVELFRFNLGTWLTLLLVVLIITYFVHSDALTGRFFSGFCG